jgi:hypothetical protein
VVYQVEGLWVQLELQEERVEVEEGLVKEGVEQEVQVGQSLLQGVGAQAEGDWALAVAERVAAVEECWVVGGVGWEGLALVNQVEEVAVGCGTGVMEGLVELGWVGVEVEADQVVRARVVGKEEVAQVVVGLVEMVMEEGQEGMVKAEVVA